MPEPVATARAMLADMKEGLAGRRSDMPMIPTYLEFGRNLPENTPAAVIDAGGTNFRAALLEFNKQGYSVLYSSKTKMPGTQGPISWNELISFIADQLAPVAEKTDIIGFCFSYNAEITPELDGRVIVMDKEVKIPDSPGKLVGKSLEDELERRGFGKKKVVVINDTAAVMLGVLSGTDKTKYSSFIGQVSGTGTNTCCAVPASSIEKLSLDSDNDMIINLESGLFTGIGLTEFDSAMDSACGNPGDKLFEKLTAGAYLCKLLRLILRQAAEDKFISAECFSNVAKLGNFDSAIVSEWAEPQNTAAVTGDADEQNFIAAVCRYLLERSARGMCANLTGIMLLENGGVPAEKPVAICAEGSLIQRSEYYRKCLFEYMDKYAHGELGLNYEFLIGDGSTLPGTAAAALLNR